MDNNITYHDLTNSKSETNRYYKNSISYRSISLTLNYDSALHFSDIWSLHQTAENTLTKKCIERTFALRSRNKEVGKNTSLNWWLANQQEDQRCQQIFQSIKISDIQRRVGHQSVTHSRIAAPNHKGPMQHNNSRPEIYIDCIFYRLLKYTALIAKITNR